MTMQTRRRWLIGGTLGLVLLGGSVGIAMATDDTDDDAAEQPPAGSDRERAEAVALGETGGGTVTSVETGDDGAAFGVEVQADSGAQVEVSLDSAYGVLGSEDDSDGTEQGGSSDELAAGSERDQAIAAALAETGGGTVTDVEMGDDGAVYGVEVMRDDGTEVEINLDASFNVTGSEIDD